ncbi:MAG: hypothetical protein ACOC47_05820 [Alkalispirochaetaceae bacterium]
MKKAILTILACAVSIASLGAVELTDRGYDVSNERVEDGITLYDVRDEAGNDLTVGTATGSFSNENMNVLEIVRETFFNMEYLDVSQMKVVFSRNRADIVVIPRRYSFDGINLGALMPSGMRFIYTDFLEFDFRMLVEGLFVRMQGQYFTEEQFVERLARAARNPAAYIQSTDPRFVFSRLDDISTQIGEIEASGVQMSTEMENLIDSFREFRTDANQGLRRLQDEFEREMEEMRTAYEGLLTDYGELTREVANLRRAVLVFENRGWFGTLRIPEESVVEEIVALKRANPSMGIDEAEAAINEGREEPVSNKVVTLVFSLYFNEFE